MAGFSIVQSSLRDLRTSVARNRGLKATATLIQSLRDDSNPQLEKMWVVIRHLCRFAVDNDLGSRLAPVARRQFLHRIVTPQNWWPGTVQVGLVSTGLIE